MAATKGMRVASSARSRPGSRARNAGEIDRHCDEFGRDFDPGHAASKRACKQACRPATSPRPRRADVRSWPAQPFGVIAVGQQFPAVKPTVGKEPVCRERRAVRGSAGGGKDALHHVRRGALTGPSPPWLPIFGTSAGCPERQGSRPERPTLPRRFDRCQTCPPSG